MKPQLTERGLVATLSARGRRIEITTVVSNGFIGRGYVLGATIDEALSYLEEIGYLDEHVQKLNGGGFGIVFY